MEVSVKNVTSARWVQLEPGGDSNLRSAPTWLVSMCKHTLTNESQDVRVGSMSLNL